ncbi:MAG: class I SAM-dependent methyltransferase [Pseudomonadota bacterium]
MDPNLIEELDARYPPKKSATIDPETRVEMGRIRATQLLKAIGRWDRNRLRDFLELGCGNGAVCSALQTIGRNATGIDLRTEEFDEAIIRRGVSLRKMDVARLEFRENSFDYVFSFDGLEHYAEPELTLDEASRVLRPYGFLYCQFGPLYNSAKGLHSSRKFAVPYGHHLFPEDVIQKFCRNKGRGPVEFTDVNRWSLRKFRDLWSQKADRFDRIFYWEEHFVKNVDLIEKHATCFRSKVNDFAELTVSYIHGLFRKKK